MAAHRLGQLAEILQAQLWGDPEHLIVGLQAPEQASREDLVVLLDPQWQPQIEASAARAVLLAATEPPAALKDRELLVVEHPRKAFAQLLQLFYPETPIQDLISPQALLEPGVELEAPVEIGPFAVIGRESRIGARSRIGAQTVIGAGVEIGQDVRIGPRVTISDGVQIGDRVVIHAGTVIGSDGYGFYQDQGRHHKIPQRGSVEIHADVEIGANVTIDCGTLGNTVIGAGTKIDNLVQIGHNVRIGRHCLLIAQVGISGSTQLGDHVILAGQTGVAGHLQIGAGVVAAGKSGITRHLEAGLKVSGFPAQEHRQELREQAALRKLPALLRWWQAQEKASRS